ncbi:MAG TPA: helix-turn-helix domain-containing protein [Candidatus Mediterraneibacter stercoripullorum]|nr:helix-turn-helix domain-containing protein [Candidatus Mediterraneibacter stercoripullorum]
MGEVRFMISEAAKQVSVESHVLRYWEEELGLTIGRTEMGHRYYTRDDIQLFRCIKKLKDEGMLLKDLKPLIPELKQTRLKLKEAEAQASSEPETAQDAAVGNRSDNFAPESALSGVSAASPAGKDTDSPTEVVIPLRQLDQVRALISDVVSEAVANNNEVLKKDISNAVTADVIHEIDYLLQAKDRQQEEHFRKLDALIRQQQANRRETVKGNPILKLRKIFT